MKLPRDMSGEELAQLLGRYGYNSTRQTGSHMRLTTIFKGTEHHITIPQHKSLRIGTLSKILKDVAAYLEMDLHLLSEELFRK